MTDTNKVDLAEIRKRVTRLSEIKTQISALTKEQEELLEYLHGLGTVLRELQDDLNSLMPASGLSIDKTLPVKALGLSVRILNCLVCEDIRTIGQLVQKTEDELIRTPNFGKKSMGDLKEALAKHGLSLHKYS